MRTSKHEMQGALSVFDCESDLLDRALDSFIGPVQRRALTGATESTNGDPPSVLILPNPSCEARDKIVREGYTHVHCWGVLPSRNTPRWLLPVGDPSTAVEATRIYEPLATTTRLLKSL